MNRRNFLHTSSIATAGLLVPSPLLFTSCSPNEIYFEIVTEIALSLLEGCTYAACMAGIKNHRICTIVSKVMKTAADIAVNSYFRTRKSGTEDNGRGRQVLWNIEIKTKKTGKVARIGYGLSLLDDTLDVLKTIGCPDGSCRSGAINWEYIGLFGVGRFPETARQYVSERYVRGLSEFERCIMRNEMYARHGYRFHRNPSAIGYFEQQNWYRSFPENLRTYNDKSVYDDYFNEYEIANFKLIKKFPNDC